MLPDKITVQVDCTEGEVDKSLYNSPTDCYVARALKQAGYDVLSAGSFMNDPRLLDGKDIIKYKYDPPFTMSFYTLIKAFENKEVLTINMTKI